MTRVEQEPPAAPLLAQAGHHAYVFGDFVLDVERGTLLHGGREVPLRPKSFRVLRYLVTHAERLVMKDELMRAVWGTVVVTDGSLTQCLADVRRALGDERRSMVRTVPRRGYLFDLPVQERACPADSPVPAESRFQERAANGVEAAAVLKPGNGVRSAGRNNIAVAALAAVALGVAFLGRHAYDIDIPGTAVGAAPERSIAVLPFVDLSPAADHGYFADGISDALIGMLAKTPELHVIARTSSFYFKDRALDVRTIGRQLNVAYVLEGSVRTAGDRVRVTAQLVRTDDGGHVWSHAFERNLGNVLQVQDAIAAAVARELHVELAVTAPKKPTDPIVHQHYLQAHYLYNRRGEGDLARAEASFRRAVEIDPDFAPAWAGLAATYWVAMADFGMPRDEGLARMKDAVDRALAADPDLPDAHLRAANYFSETGDAQRTHWHAARAEALDPDHPIVLGRRSSRAAESGDKELAIELERRAIDLDPMSWITRANHIQSLMSFGRYDAARSLLDETRELLGSDLRDFELLEAFVALYEGDFAEAVASARRAPGGPEADGALAMAYFSMGEDAEAARRLRRLESATDSESAFRAAEVHAWMGARDTAWQWLRVAEDRSLAESPGLCRLLYFQVVASPALASLREEPRWLAMRERLDPDVAEGT